jgi:hypothetical protein
VCAEHPNWGFEPTLREFWRRFHNRAPIAAAAAPASPQPLKPEPRQPSEAETQAVTVLAGLGEAKGKCAGLVAEIAAQHPTLDCAGIIRAYYAKAAPIAAAAASSGP